MYLMDERVKRDVKMFLIVLVACLVFVGAVETFTGLLSQTREKNIANQEAISSIRDIIKNSQNEQDTFSSELVFYDDFFSKNFL